MTKEKSASLSQLAWQRFRKNGVAMFSSFVVILSILIAALGYLIMPDSTPNANEQILEIAARKPGFTVTILKVPKQQAPDNTGFLKKLVYGAERNYFSVPVFKHQMVGDTLLVETYTGATHNEGELKKYLLKDFPQPIESNFTERTFVFGTDRFGRDMLSRMILGTRISLAVGFIAVIISLIVGISLGAIAGFFRVDRHGSTGTHWEKGTTTL